MRLIGHSMSSDNGRTSLYTRFYIIFQIIGLTLIFYVYNWIVQYRGGFSITEPKIIFNWHPLLMTIAFIYLLANSILHYRTFQNNTKRKLKNQHALIHGCILILIVIAGFAAFVSHQYAKPPIPHLYSLHSWLGVLTIVMFLSQLFSGLWCFLYPGAAKQHRETLAPYHVFFGISIFILAVATAVLGFCEKIIFSLDKQYKLLPAEGVLGNILGILCVVYCLLVVYMITKPEFKRHPKLEYETLL
ncbi:cytochrome b561 [Acyrthosiphon pisum]|uniref:Cytochrome b561 domain-containing protein n=1 Tax=Acyrthosiphon pisum TaxID=7029 RepID=A0A8R2JPF9_ACYPI|nr:cytochrome b561 [Acyrthosiphon pisum]XP_029343251.1 cytochrome b561 [Acyrthosiphon pisum]XP_029343252.1 cytochrome b561 [Acyrthosiphon pisum]XP_029343253.1 cytochrome b561 [Acyrthosiphon pisum]XP_029343254.1 cytochrome b561 [Acyrthosiphon pisum]XP_029343255.1 cytochrome b561 [Acyrthosiphon pisum]|eukprot:XP_001950854.1 PREDICTED: cytochrome b561-like [Acyrthosiphon pisum]